MHVVVVHILLCSDAAAPPKEEPVLVEFHVFGMKMFKLHANYPKAIHFAEFKRIFMELIAGTPSAQHFDAADPIFRTRDKQDLVDDTTLRISLAGGGNVYVGVVSGRLFQVFHPLTFADLKQFSTLMVEDVKLHIAERKRFKPGVCL